MAAIQADFEQCRMEQYMFSFRLFKCVGCIVHQRANSMRGIESTLFSGSSKQKPTPEAIVLLDK